MPDKNLRVKYVDITYPDVNNGPGCRLTIWISGCDRNCEDCHNKWLQDYEQGEIFDSLAEQKIIDIFNSHKYLRGITLSGGDPLQQNIFKIQNMLESIKNIKSKINREIDVWVYTGRTYERIPNMEINWLNKVCDVMVDGPYDKNLRNIMLPFRGSSNQRLIDLKKSTKDKVVVIPDITFQK